MILENPFAIEGRWFKGNLHTHTTNSDGDRSPVQIVEHYRNQGYDFLFITDHNRVTEVRGLSSADFLVLPGAELSAKGDEARNGYHLVALNIGDTEGLSPDLEAQEVIDRVREKGGEVVVAHPYWSALTIHDLLRLEGYIGLEIYNTSCFYSIAKGHSLVYWDALLARGCRVWGIAADDVHWHFNDHRPNDACGGWIMVKAPALTVDNILAALRQGHFYASNGPTIEAIRMGEQSITAQASKSRSINFIADGSRGESFTSLDGRPLSWAEFTPAGKEKYLRVECIRADGTAAWSNPLWLGER
ncbi:MAG TPA: hypothetical protein EYP85_10605 [Armatimonadetes bacterium]|nr:hypothetical protein [Armatimonadota bacterium]